MGFDLEGASGNLFYNNVWAWRPLWYYVGKACGNILSAEDYKDGFSNDPQFIPAGTARSIGERLQFLVENGETEIWAEEYRSRLKSMPDAVCELCDGKGYRADLKGATCARCQGLGSARPWKAYYPFYIENVRRFAEFCLESDGFWIS